MKKSILFIIVVFGLAACKFETLSNGNFDGNWHFTQVDTLSTGKVTDVSEERIFWAVEGKLLQVRYFGSTDNPIYSNAMGYYMRFSKSDTELVLSEPYVNGWHQDYGENGGDTPLKDTTELIPYGIMKMPEQFAIEELSGSKMTLRSNELRLHFNKQ